MKKVLLVLVVAGLTTMVGIGQKKETRPASNFTGIDASSVFNITVARGSTESLMIEADDELMPYVRSEVRNGVLHLFVDKSIQEKKIKTLKAFIVMKNLDRLSLSGTCKLTANDLFTPDTFKGSCSGVSNMTVNINTGQLDIDASGVSKIQLKANVNGNAQLDVSGTSKIQAELKANHVKIRSSGVSSVDLSGSATDVIIGASGTSKANAEKFTVRTATVESSGTSKITVNVVETLKARSSGSSSVGYKGSPTIEVHTGVTSKVKKI